MSAKQIESVILKSFEHTSMKSFTFMEACGNKVIMAENQAPTGDDILEGIAKRKAACYICDDQNIKVQPLYLVTYRTCSCYHLVL